MGFSIDVTPLDPKKGAWTKSDLYHRLFEAGDEIKPHPEYPGEFYFSEGVLMPTPVEHATGDQWFVSVRLGFSKDRTAQIERLQRIARSFGGRPVPPEL
jgi:hypothetical protein